MWCDAVKRGEMCTWCRASLLNFLAGSTDVSDNDAPILSLICPGILSYFSQNS